MCEQLFLVIHKTFGHHPKMHLLCPLLSTAIVLVNLCMHVCLCVLRMKAMLSGLALINSNIFFGRFAIFGQCLCYTHYIEHSIMGTHLCHHHRKKLLILLAPQFQYYEFYIYTIFMVLIFSRNDHRCEYRSHTWTHTRRSTRIVFVDKRQNIVAARIRT